jgi:glycosyltransferase involved in cell wall biosynthesis
MIIGINICGTEKENGQSDKFIIDCFTKIAIKHSAHQFVFIIDKEIGVDEKNVFINVSPRPKSAFFWKFWYKYTLEPVIKKQKIDLLINCNAICALNSKIPQMLFINDMHILHTSSGTKKYDWFYKKHIVQFLQKTKRVVTISNFLRQELIAKYKIEEQKIDVLYPAIDKRYQSIPFEEKEKIKEKYTNGKEFFLYAGDISAEKNLISLLKAFSFFKKRQKSNMQLIILAETIDGADFIESLKTYKYRDEIQLLQTVALEESVVITASAYAFVYPSLYEPFPKKMLEAMQAGIPVIANYLTTISETCGDAVEYANTNNFEEIAEKMMLLFKDENKRNELIAKGNKQVLPYNMDKMTDELWQSIIKTTQA